MSILQSLICFGYLIMCSIDYVGQFHWIGLSIDIIPSVCAGMHSGIHDWNRHRWRDSELNWSSQSRRQLSQRLAVMSTIRHKTMKCRTCQWSERIDFDFYYVCIHVCFNNRRNCVTGHKTGKMIVSPFLALVNDLIRMKCCFRILFCTTNAYHRKNGSQHARNALIMMPNVRAAFFSRRIFEMAHGSTWCMLWRCTAIPLICKCFSSNNAATFDLENF